MTYNPLGQVATFNRTNGVTTTNTYNANAQYRLTNRVSQKTGQSKLQDLTYTYDALGNIMTLVDNSVSATKKTATYTYDVLYRLTSAAIINVALGQTPYTQTFTYNILGNITSKDGVVYSYTTPNKVNPHAPTVIAGQALAYNDNGNLLTDGVHANIWNYKNELTSSTSGGSTATYTYNHDGMRVKKQTPSTEIYSPTSFYSEENIKKSKTISLEDMLLGSIETTTMGAITAHTPRYALVDHLGGTEKTVDANAAIVSTLDYYPYGGHRIDTGGTPERTYIGEKYDPESGYNYLNARYTDNVRGQFLSQDPVFWEIGQSEDGKSILLNPQTQNSYSYGLNNPINFSDEQGRCATSNGVSMSACTGMVVGIGQGLVDTVTGLYSLATTNPLVSAQNMYNGIKNLPQSVNEYAQLQNDPNASDFDKAKAGGEVAFGLFAMKGAGKGVQQGLTKAGKQSFFEGTYYSDKVLGQIKRGDDHAFPELVKNYEQKGTVKFFKGDDGKKYQKLTIPGKYNGSKGNFSFIKDERGRINHRQFERSKNKK